MSIAHVAKAAGVSQATVSRVINRRPGVSVEVMRAVRTAIQTLGYEPPPLDRRPGRRVPLRGREPVGTIAVVLLDNLYHHTPGVFASHLRGIEFEAADQALNVQVIHATDPARLRVSLSRQIEGLVLLGSQASGGVLKVLERFPQVWLSSHHGPGGDAVLAGNHQIAQLAAEYLIRRGHKHLALLAVMSNYPAYPARAEAFRFIGSRSGATVEVIFDEQAAAQDVQFPGIDALQQRMQELVDRLSLISPRPTGLFIPNDMMTAMCYVALRARGIAPGRDVEIISCNNEIPYLVGLDPRPATIDIGAEMIGRRSVEQLLRKIRRPEETRQVHIAISPALVEPDQW